MAARKVKKHLLVIIETKLPAQTGFTDRGCFQFDRIDQLDRPTVAKWNDAKVGAGRGSEAYKVPMKASKREEE